MDYVDFGNTAMKVSVAGLGCGGNSRLGLGRDGREADAVRLVCAAHDRGVNFFDTAAAYGTEGVLGKAVAEIGRQNMVISTKCLVRRKGERITAADFSESLDNSLVNMGIETVDVFNLHGLHPRDYDYAYETLLPVMIRAKESGKIRHIGISETSPGDPDQEMLKRALTDPVWEAAMFAFHMLHQGARRNVFPLTMKHGVGTMLMFVVRNIFSQPDVLRDNIHALANRGALPAELASQNEPLDFLLHEAGARDLTDAAYRFARHEPGAHVVLFGTSRIAHLDANIASILRPPLPEADRQSLRKLFGHLSGVGLDLPGPASRDGTPGAAKPT